MMMEENLQAVSFNNCLEEQTLRMHQLLPMILKEMHNVKEGTKQWEMFLRTDLHGQVTNNEDELNSIVDAALATAVHSSQTNVS